MQAVHDLGDPGLLFGPREMRLYPNGKLAAHVLGGASFGKEGVNAAEVIGVAGVEKQFDGYLRDPANGNAPLQLSLDLTIQAAAERVLYGGMKLMNAKGATAILMDVHTGEVISVVSLPSFDPNERPRPPVSGDPSDSPLFNRAVQGVYELGSTFKIFAVAQAHGSGAGQPGNDDRYPRPAAVGQAPDPGFPQLRQRVVGDQDHCQIVQHRHGAAGPADRGGASAAVPQRARPVGADAVRDRRSRGRQAASAEEVVRTERDDHFLWPWSVVQPDASGRWLCGHRQRRLLRQPDDPETDRRRSTGRA